jgi:hypothetical protein
MAKAVSGHAIVQKMMRVYVKSNGLGSYVANSAIPMGGGTWQFYAKKHGKSERHAVSQETLAMTYANAHTSRKRKTYPHVDRWNLED